MNMVSMAKRFASKVYKLFKKLGIFGYSSKKSVFGVHPLVISTAFIGLSLLLFSSIRKFVKSVISDSTFREVVLECLTTIEMCVAFFELIIITENWGVPAYGIFLFALLTIWEFTWTDASACPYVTIEDVIEGNRDHSNAGLRVFGQLLGALISFAFVETFWALELVQTHRGKAFEECEADLQVSMIPGAVIEAVGTLLCRLGSKVVYIKANKFAPVLSAFFSTLVVIAAFDTTGGYFNPALATALKLGCEGNSFIEHVVVYWIGSIIGSVLSIYVFKSQMIQDYINDIKPKED